MLDKNKLKVLPIHDAELISFLFTQDDTGNTRILFDIKITDDSYDCGYEIPKKNCFTSLVFENCWWIKNEFYLNVTIRDTINRLDSIENSKIKKNKDIKTKGEHYYIEFNSGSKFEIIAEDIYLMA
ncbi:MAG: hypothetical protein V2A64_07900 [Candidatus Omnitrophota bacterium]